ncbi:small acid-soluble spore protein P [Bacillus sp. M6-12]|nr:small acid-soluble spore protein P [Bacillus sp. M6-12]PLS14701.1 small acid-soluble spore protein P [Bacillus sp. M6-12]
MQINGKDVHNKPSKGHNSSQPAPLSGSHKVKNRNHSRQNNNRSNTM